MADIGDFEFVFDDSGCDCPEPIALLQDTPRSAVPTGSGQFGVDIDAVDDVPLRWALCSGYRNLGNALARRILFLKESINEGFTDEGLENLRGRITQAIEEDPRIQSLAKLGFDYNRGTSALAVSIVGNTAEGPFRFIVKIGELTVEVLDGRAAA